MLFIWDLKRAVCLMLLFHCALCDIPVFYTENDHIETVDTSTFYSDVLNSDRVSLVEFYANWCYYSQQFRVHYKAIANETKLWNRFVRIAAIDCGNQIVNGDLCWASNFTVYPTFKFIPAYSKNLSDLHQELDENYRSEAFMRVLIRFVEQQENKPENWPDLSPYKSSLENIFENDEKKKYMILVAEPDDSYLGRKLIMDLSSFQDQIITKRVTPSTNLELFNILQSKDVNIEVPSTDIKPKVFLIRHMENHSKRFVSIEDHMRVQKTETVHNDIDLSIIDGPHGEDQEIRYAYLKMVLMFIRYSNLNYDHDHVERDLDSDL